MSHQDWTTVVFTKPKKIINKLNITYTQPKLKYNENGEEIIKVYKLSSEEIKNFIKIRNELKLSRADLAKKLYCQSSEIDNLECGKSSNSIVGGNYKKFLNLEFNKINKMT